MVEHKLLQCNTLEWFKYATLFTRTSPNRWLTYSFNITFITGSAGVSNISTSKAPHSSLMRLDPRLIGHQAAAYITGLQLHPPNQTHRRFVFTVCGKMTDLMGVFSQTLSQCNTTIWRQDYCSGVITWEEFKILKQWY